MRGFRRTGLIDSGNGGGVWSPRCAPMAVGSVPYADAAEAYQLLLRTTPEVMAWPQLPRRSFLENMYVQFAEGLPGLKVDVAAGRAWVVEELPVEELAAFMERLEAGDPQAFGIGADHAAGLHGLPAVLREMERPPRLLKGQVTGPVSLCMSTAFLDKRALFYDDTMREVATEMLAARARWQEQFLRPLAATGQVLMMVDEPFLAQWGSGYLSMPDNLVVPALRRVVGAVECLRGIHICGGTDWAKVTRLPLDLLNFDAADHVDALLANAGPVGVFLDEGGMLAWGVVPNDDRALSLSAESAGASVLAAAETLGNEVGIAEEAILAQSFVSPACGTGALPPATAARCFELAGEVSSWLRDRL
ncbi:MAG: hypothetical protein GXX83_05120 [Gaiellales bacterium]|nr:hypothetical protein [Gaiellales bacterium]